MKRKGIGYVRVSSKEQVDGQSLDTQEKAIRKYCRQHDIEVVTNPYREEGESAKTADRPRLKELLKKCQRKNSGIDVVIVHSFSRLARNTHDHQNIKALLKKYDTSTKSVTEPTDDTPYGNYFENQMAAMAQLENEVKAERSGDGMRTALEKGKWTHQPPQGYLRNPQKVGPCLLPDPERALQILEAFRMFASGRYTKKEIVDRLNAEGYRTPRGNRLSPQTLEKILCNPLYGGWVVSFGGKERHKGDFDPIVPEELFLKVQRILSGGSPYTVPRQRDREDFPLKRFIKCDLCGSPLTASWSRGRNGKRYPYYRCPGKECKGVSIRRDKIEAKFLEVLDGLKPGAETIRLYRAIVVDAWQDRQAGKQSYVTRLDKRIAEIGERQNRLFNAFTDGKGALDTATFNELYAKLKEDLQTAREARDALEIDDLDMDGLLTFAEGVLRESDTLWSELDLKQKLVFQKSIFPEGLRFDGSEFGNADIPFIFKALKDIKAGESKVASPRGLEPK